MKRYKNPFLVLEDFISPLTCEEIVDTISILYPNEDAEGRPIRSLSLNKLAEVSLHDYLDEAASFVEEYYDVEVVGIHPLQFEYYPTGCMPIKPVCENSIPSGDSWVRANNRDFVGTLFLSDFQEKAPFDPMYEVRGGKLQFPTHGFGFNPKRGMLVIFPGNENFVHTTSAIEVGELHQIKIFFTVKGGYTYDRSKFPGNYEVWFP